MKFLDKCYCAFVNLDHRKDRLEHMRKELKRVGIEAQRLRGFRPNDTPLSGKAVERMRRKTPGAIGCFYSQLTVMAQAERNNKHALVMEDDLIFCNDMDRRFKIIDDFTEQYDWDVIWLGGTFHLQPHWHQQTIGRDAENTKHPNFMRTFGAFSTHAYIVNRDSIDYIMELLGRNMYMAEGIDHAFIQVQPALECFSFVPGCVIQMDNKSDIGNGMTRFSGFRKLGAHWFQRRMEDFDPLRYDWGACKI